MRGMHDAHSGHQGDSGIQRHSCGPTYPWYVLGIGDSWVGFNGATGELLSQHEYNRNVQASRLAAYADAEHDIHVRMLVDEIAEAVPITLDVQRVFTKLMTALHTPTMKLAA